MTNDQPGPAHLPGVEATSRIAPLEAPFDEEVGDILAAMMPPGVPPIALFRTFAKNLPMATAMRRWGSYELSRELSLSMRQREIVINRVTALCRCEYEWGVHVAFFADRVGLSPDQISSLTHGSSSDSCWSDESERALIEVVDSLHRQANVDDARWRELAGYLSDQQMLDVCMLSGWYHAISFAANAARVPLEEGAPRFVDYARGTES